MDLWKGGTIEGLVDNTVALSRLMEGRQGQGEDDDKRQARQYNGMVLVGKLHQAVQRATARQGGGVLYPTDQCTKSGQPVVEVLKGKHPDTRVLDVLDPNCTAFEEYDRVPEVVPLDFTQGSVAHVASHMCGSGGPLGQDAVTLSNWLLRFGVASEELREEIALLADWLSNGSPPWAAYRALIAGCLVALDKCPGTRPVGIGEILRCLIAKMVIRATGDEAKVADQGSSTCSTHAEGTPAGSTAAGGGGSSGWGRGGTE
eukprot:3478240-Ditylum_brightwellii.AAC.1